MKDLHMQNHKEIEDAENGKGQTNEKKNNESAPAAVRNPLRGRNRIEKICVYVSLLNCLQCMQYDTGSAQFHCDV